MELPNVDTALQSRVKTVFRQRLSTLTRLSVEWFVKDNSAAQRTVRGDRSQRRRKANRGRNVASCWCCVALQTPLSLSQFEWDFKRKKGVVAENEADFSSEIIDFREEVAFDVITLLKPQLNGDNMGDAGGIGEVGGGRVGVRTLVKSAVSRFEGDGDARLTAGGLERSEFVCALVSGGLWSVGFGVSGAVSSG